MSFFLKHKFRMELSKEQQTVLFALVREGDVVGLREALDALRSSDRPLSEILNERDEEWMTLFLAACQHENIDMINLLVELALQSMRKITKDRHLFT